MQRFYLTVQMGAVGAGVGPHPLYLPLKAPEPHRLVLHAVYETAYNICQRVKALVEVVESHVQVVPQVGFMAVVHPLGCRLGGVGRACGVDGHMGQPLIYAPLLDLNPTSQARHQRSQ